MVINAGLALALVGPFGSAGLAGAVAAASLVEAGCLAVMVKAQGSALIGAGLVWRVIRMLVASIGMAALVWAALALMRGFSWNEPARASDPRLRSRCSWADRPTFFSRLLPACARPGISAGWWPRRLRPGYDPRCRLSSRYCIERSYQVTWIRPVS